MKSSRITSSLLVLATLTFTATAAPAMPAITASAATFDKGAPSTVEQVRYYGRRYGGGYGYRRGGRGLGIGLGIAGAVIAGSIIASEARRSRYYDSYGDESGADRCARSFRSYDPDSGTYTTYQGETRRCPFL